MYAWMNKEGKWLVVREFTTHTGHHVVPDWTTDINRAHVASRLHPKLGMVDAARIPVNLEEIRIVTVKTELMDAVGGAE